MASEPAQQAKQASEPARTIWLRRTVAGDWNIQSSNTSISSGDNAYLCAVDVERYLDLDAGKMKIGQLVRLDIAVHVEETKA